MRHWPKGRPMDLRFQISDLKLSSFRRRGLGSLQILRVQGSCTPYMTWIWGIAKVRLGVRPGGAFGGMWFASSDFQLWLGGG